MTLNNYENTISRSLLHSRTIFSEGYVREDGLFDIESIIKDTKSYDIPRTDGTCLKKGAPLHEMHIVLTINIEMKILDVSAKTISAPYKICSNANFKIKSLIGATIGPGWKNKINKLIGNIEGCTHVRELLVSMATVSFQTVFGEKSKRTRDAINKGEKDPYPSDISRPSLLNTCYAFDEKSEVTKKQWPEYWKKS
jgi:hypothetical protein